MYTFEFCGCGKIALRVELLSHIMAEERAEWFLTQMPKITHINIINMSYRKVIHQKS